MSLRCNILGHKPCPDRRHAREIVPTVPYPTNPNDFNAKWAYEEEHYRETYTNCVRCDAEIVYVRFVNVWTDKENNAERNLTRWVDTDEADKIEDLSWMGRVL